MSFTSLDFTSMGSNAYIVYNIDTGFKLLTEVLDGPVAYLSDGAAVSLGNCYMQGPVLTTLTGSFSTLSGRDRPIVKVGSSWAVVTQFLDNSNVVLDRTFDKGRLCTILSGTVTTVNNYTANTAITFKSTGVLPTNITAGQIYYVLTANTQTFTFSATVGGSPITTSGGSGLHSVYKVFSAITPSYAPDTIKDTIIATVTKTGTSPNFVYNIDPHYSVNNESTTIITTAPTLPVSGEYVGQLVLFNNLIYTWNGTSWNTGTGSPGLNNAVAYLYQRAATAPVTAPAGTFTYTFATGVLSGGTLNGYSFTIPTSNGNPLWVVAASASSSSATDTIAGTEFSTPVALASDGLAGLNSATIYLYQRAASAPAVPSVNVTYTFSTGAATGQNNGWTQTIPAGSDPIWVTTATAASTTATDIIATGEWAAPAILAQNGTNGTSAVSGYLTNESQALFAYANGVITSYTPATGSFVIVSGTTDISTSFTLSTLSNPQNLTVAYVNRTYTVSAGFDASEDTASLTIRATGSGAYAGITIDKVFSLSKTRGGYEIVATLPAGGDPRNFAGSVVFLTTDNKLYRYNGTAWIASVPAGDITDQLTAAQIASLAASQVTGQLTDAQLAGIAAGKISGQLSDTQLAAIASTKITGQLSDAQLAGIAAGKISGTITGTQISDGAISTAKIAAGAVTAASIAADTITAANIAAGAITASELAAGSVIAGKIAAGTIVADDIAANAITTAKIFAGAVTANQIAADTITAANIAAGAITASELAAGSVTAASIAAGTITATQIAADTITANQIAANAITATELNANAVTADKIEAGAVTAAKVSVTELSAISANMGTITAGEIRSGTTGQDRLVITPGVIEVFDASNTRRIRLGVWT
jgi:hypothetical protein